MSYRGWVHVRNFLNDEIVDKNPYIHLGCDFIERAFLSIYRLINCKDKKWAWKHWFTLLFDGVSHCIRLKKRSFFNVTLADDTGVSCSADCDVNVHRRHMAPLSSSATTVSAAAADAPIFSCILNSILYALEAGKPAEQVSTQFDWSDPVNVQVWALSCPRHPPAPDRPEWPPCPVVVLNQPAARTASTVRSTM